MSAAVVLSPVTPRITDRTFMLRLIAAMFVLTLIVVIVSPKNDDTDPEPTTYNAGTRGAKAAYLLLPELGYTARRWEQPPSALAQLDAPHTTLILTDPSVSVKDVAGVRALVADFLHRGGHVLATGPSGAVLLPDGATAPPNTVLHGLCYTKPEGPGPLAAAGQLPIDDQVRWASPAPQFHVEQRCGSDAVVVRFAVGKGEAIWWASPMPLTNAGLSDDPSLRLLLASLGPPDRTILFDEYLHTWHDTVFKDLKALPWWPLGLQCAAVALLLLLSRSRRNGPLRMPVYLPRTSPIEFAESMGHLYAKANAIPAATAAARNRLLETLRLQAGIPRELLKPDAPQVAQVLAARYPGDWTLLDQHLAQSAPAAVATLAPKSALALVQALDADTHRLQHL